MSAPTPPRAGHPRGSRADRGNGPTPAGTAAGDLAGFVLERRRPLPFLCVHRDPEARDDGLDRLVRSEPAHLVVSGEQASAPSVPELVTELAEQGAERFGSFLVLELWAPPPDREDPRRSGQGATAANAPGRGSRGGSHRWSRRRRPTFRVHAPALEEPPTTVDVLTAAVGELSLSGRRVGTDVATSPAPAPPGLPPLLDGRTMRRLGCALVGLELPAELRAPGGTPYPLQLRRLHEALVIAVRRALFEFTQVQTSYEAADYRVLGPHEVSDPAVEVDRGLTEVARSFGFLLAVTPVDAMPAWETFVASGYTRPPHFHYRPLPIDPELLKRRLYALPLEDVHDPTLASLFRGKRRELSRQLDLLEDRDSETFRHGSLQLHGGVEPELAGLARDVLDRCRAAQHRAEDAGDAGDAGVPDGGVEGAGVDAETFAARLREELAAYGEQGAVPVDVKVRDDVASLLVERGSVFVPTELRLEGRRVDALVHHEVGTHVVTWVNGRAQPLHLLEIGTPGYEATQEGLAVLAEYLVGGLTVSRLVMLAGRTLAVDSMARGEPFLGTFGMLHDELGFPPAVAFRIAARVHRSGGLAKDACYLRGLRAVLDHLAGGGPLEPLLVGKVALAHLPVVEDLRWRRIVEPPALRPRWLDLPEARDRLDAVRDGRTVTDLVEVAA